VLRIVTVKCSPASMLSIFGNDIFNFIEGEFSPKLYSDRQRELDDLIGMKIEWASVTVNASSTKYLKIII